MLRLHVVDFASLFLHSDKIKLSAIAVDRSLDNRVMKFLYMCASVLYLPLHRSIQRYETVTEDKGKGAGFGRRG